MNDGAMFAELKSFSEEEYWKTHPYIYIAANEEVYRYEVFSCYRAGLQDPTYGLVILPGGMPGSKNLRDNERVLALVRAMVAENKITAAICAAPIVLEKAGVLKGIRYTMYPGFEAEMSSRPTGNLTEVCSNIITGKGPGAAFAFAACVAKALGSDAEPMYRDGMFIQG